MLYSREAAPTLSEQQDPFDPADMEAEGAPIWLCPAPPMRPRPFLLSETHPHQGNH